MKTNPSRLDQSTAMRLKQIQAMVESGATEMTGKTKRASDGGEGQFDSGAIVGRFKGGMSVLYPELAHAGVSPGVAAKAVRRGKGIVYQRLYRETRRELAKTIPEGRRRGRGAATVPPHARLTRKCKECGIAHSTNVHRFHGAGAFHQTHMFGFNPKRASSASKFEPRVRFNWGFWDGLADRKHGRNRKAPFIDASYKAGYQLGHYWPDANVQTSDDAWTEYQWKKKHPFGGSYGGKLAAVNARRKNPPAKMTKIYGRVLSIDAQKTQPHRCDAECRGYRHRYTHPFKLSPAMWGLPNRTRLVFADGTVYQVADGSILIEKR